MTSPDYSPIDVFEKNLHFWWLLLICGIAGGILGWFFHFAQAPIYEAQAVMTASIDYTQTGPINSTEEDRSMVVIGELFGTTPVREKVIQIAQQKGIELTLNEFYQISSIDRKQNLWFLRIRSSDPNKAAAIANIWLDQSYQAAVEAQSHSMKLQVIQRQYNSLLACFPQTEITATPANNWKTPTPVPAPEFCVPSNSAYLPTQIAQLSAQIAAEKAQTHAIIPALTFAVSEYAVIPSQPIRFNANSFVFAGMVIGFAMGIFLITAFIHPKPLLKNDQQ
jgi:hypothetical protein